MGSGYIKVLLGLGIIVLIASSFNMPSKEGMSEEAKIAVLENQYGTLENQHRTLDERVKEMNPEKMTSLQEQINTLREMVDELIEQMASGGSTFIDDSEGGGEPT